MERRITDKRGVILPLVALALVVLLAVVGLTVDVGQLVIAAQQAQDVADAGALGGGMGLPDYDAATDATLSLVEANNESAAGFQASCSPDNGDIAFWGPGESIPEVGSLGTAAWGMRVTTHVPVNYVFVRVVGFEDATVTRSATVVRMPVGGVPITPMWINYETDYQYGQVQELLMATGPHAEPSFGERPYLMLNEVSGFDLWAAFQSGLNRAKEVADALQNHRLPLQPRLLAQLAGTHETLSGLVEEDRFLGKVEQTTFLSRLTR